MDDYYQRNAMYGVSVALISLLVFCGVIFSSCSYIPDILRFSIFLEREIEQADEVYHETYEQKKDLV